MNGVSTVRSARHSDRVVVRVLQSLTVVWLIVGVVVLIRDGSGGVVGAVILPGLAGIVIGLSVEWFSSSELILSTSATRPARDVASFPPLGSASSVAATPPVQVGSARRASGGSINYLAYASDVDGEVQCPHCGNIFRSEATAGAQHRCAVCSTSWLPPSSSLVAPDVAIRSWLHNR